MLLDKKQSELTEKEKKIVEAMFEYDLDEIQAEDFVSNLEKQEKEDKADKPKTKRHYVKSDKPRAKPTRTPNGEKREIIQYISECLNKKYKAVTVSNVERQIDFGDFSITLTQHRKPKV